MKNDKINYILCLLFFTALAAVAFRCTWPVDHVFSSSDLNIGRLAYIRQQLPESFVGYYRATELLGVSSQGISLFGVLLAAMPLTVFANGFYGFGLVAASIFLVWFLRIWKRSWVASIFGALIAFWFNFTMFAVSGHVGKVEVLTFTMLALVLIEKAIRADQTRKTIGLSLLSGISVGIMLNEQQDVALLSGLFLSSYCFFRLIQVHGRTFLRWITVLIPMGAVAVLLAGGTMLKSYDQNISKATTLQDSAEDKWNFITQWSLVPEEWPDLIASGWGGWSSQNPKGPYWGKIGRSAGWSKTKQGFRDFKLTSNYIGIIPFLLGIFGFIIAVQSRKTEEGKVIMFWSIAGVVGFWLAFGKFSLLYKLFYHLPLVGNIRAPVKLLDNFQMCLGIICAYGLDRLIKTEPSEKRSRVLWISSAVVGGLMVMNGLRLLAFPASQAEVFSQMKFTTIQADLMVNNMANAWIHGGILALACAGLVFVVWKGLNSSRWVASAIVLLVALDSLVLASNYFKATDIKALKKGNIIVNYIKEHQGDERTYFVDQSGIYNQWIGADGPYHDLNLFNIWQMPRMSADYKEFLGKVGRNPVRMWELSTVRYVAAPTTVMQQFLQNPQLEKQFNPVLNYQVPTKDGMRQDVLLEFKGTISRVAQFHGWESIVSENQCELLVSPQHNPTKTVLLDPSANLGRQDASADFQPLEAYITKRKATVYSVSDNQTIIRFSQYFQPEWRVFVDGKLSELLRIDYLFMGVSVPSGEHVVEFRCIDGRRKVAFVLGVFLVSILTALWLLRADRKEVV